MNTTNLFIETYLKILNKKSEYINQISFVNAGILRDIERVMVNYRFDGLDSDDTSVTSRYFGYKYDLKSLTEMLYHIKNQEFYKNNNNALILSDEYILKKEVESILLPLEELEKKLLREIKIKKLENLNNLN